MLFFKRISVIGIIKSHFRTFYKGTDGKETSWIELLLLASLVVGSFVITIWLAIDFSDAVVNGLVSAYAIIGGFLISAMFIIVSYTGHIEDTFKKYPKSEVVEIKKLQKEIFANVSFGVFISLIGVLLCIIHLAAEDCWYIVSAFISSVLVLFLHTLLMVLKRLNVIFSKTLSSNPAP